MSLNMPMDIRHLDEHKPQIGKRVYIDPKATVIGQVDIGDDSSVWPQAVIRGDIHHIQIGQGCSIQDGAIIHVTHDGPFNPGGYATQLGNYVTVGHGAILHGCTIQNHCLIGIQSTILDGVTIEDHVILAAGSLVPPGKTLISGYLWVGSPVKKQRALTEKEMAYFEYTAEYYIRLKDRYLSQSTK